MALNLPKLSGFGAAMDAKTRIFLIFFSILGISIIGYVAISFFGGSSSTTGASKVANPAAGLQSVPGSQLSPEYYQALRQANVQATQQAQMSGGSAVPTLVNVPGQQSFGPSGNCTVLCPGEDNVDVTNDVNDLVKQGKLTQEEADKLNALSKANVPVEQYAAALEELVRQGKLTPEQARKLLEAYKKQHANALLTDSAQSMDAMIKSGQLSVAAANELLALQKKHLTPAEYAAELERMVREGKISPAVAAQLLAQYTQQQQKELAKQGAFTLQQMAAAGQITADVAKRLADLQNKNIPVDQYEAELNRLVAEGKLTPAAAAKLLEQYKKQRVSVAATGAISQLMREGGAKAELAKRLLAMQGNNASLQSYTDELKRAVQAGTISPEMAAQLLKEYSASLTPVAPVGGVAPGVSPALPGAEDFAKLQQQLQSQQAAPTPQQAATPPTAEFLAAQAQAKAEAEQARLQRIQELQSAMSNQAQQLITAWQPVNMQHVGGSGALEGKDKQKSGAEIASGKTDKSGSSSSGKTGGVPLIKAGTILYAVLDTGVDSDYPDTPVMATIVQGPYKGAKLLGKMQAKQGPNQEKISLTFSTMGMDMWPTNKGINAFAIDPDTARTVMASDVDHHYALRYGSIMATSFLTGYSSAITNEGTSTTGIFGTSTAHPALSPGNKLAVGLGQIGTNLSSVVQKYADTPITVKVNAGVGLGILFMADVQ
jgi:polyhydroxyalkanoate synthesis regulator phasin